LCGQIEMNKPSNNDKSSTSTRFQKGQSGNPRGRPKKRKQDPRPSAFDIVIDRTLTILQDGVPREVTVDEALQHKTYQDAVNGNRAARREVLKMIAKREQAITERTLNQLPSIEQKMEDDPANADEALQILGIASHDPRWTDTPPGDRDRLLLEPWAVQAAMSRRTARKLDKKELDEARRCTLYADKIKWPDPADP
jgi:hypothetical protein